MGSERAPRSKAFTYTRTADDDVRMAPVGGKRSTSCIFSFLIRKRAGKNTVKNESEIEASSSR